MMNMKSLEKQYIEDTITSEELEKLFISLIIDLIPEAFKFF